MRRSETEDSIHNRVEKYSLQLKIGVFQIDLRNHANLPVQFDAIPDI